MAATIARAWGHDSSRTKEVHRLGSQQASVQAATWRTFVDASVDRNGGVHIAVRRDGKLLHEYTLGAE